MDYCCFARFLGCAHFISCFRSLLTLYPRLSLRSGVSYVLPAHLVVFISFYTPFIRSRSFLSISHSDIRSLLRLRGLVRIFRLLLRNLV